MYNEYLSYLLFELDKTFCLLQKPTSLSDALEKIKKPEYRSDKKQQK